MKSIKLISATTFLILLVSCSADQVEDPTPAPGPGPDEIRLVDIELDYYSSPGSNAKSLIKTRVTVDSSQRTITTWTNEEFSGNGYERRYFDESWRLTKIIHRNTPFWSEDDTIIIQCPGPGIFDIGKVNSSLSRYTLKSMPDGSQLISAVRPGGDPSSYNHRIIDKNGLLIYSAVSRWGIFANERMFQHFFYNQNRQLITVKDTVNDLIYSNIRAFEHTIVKDNSSNTVFLDFLKNMVGTDLGWIMYDPETTITPFRFIVEFSNLAFLENGAFQSNKYTIRESVNSGPYMALSSYDNSYETVYDSGGRLSVLRTFENHKIERELRIGYHD